MTRFTVDLPVPPSLNEMLELAKRRTRRSRTGGWMKKTLPVVYDQHLEAYDMSARAAIAQQGVQPPVLPWARWILHEAAFRLHNLRDPIELMASLKWPVDILVRQHFVANDSPRELRAVCLPTQIIDRKRLGITLTILKLT